MIITNELQEVVLSGLLKNSYFLAMCKKQINDGYFTSGAYKIIYKSLITYYNKYNSLPTFNEMIITIDDCFVESIGVTAKDTKDLCEKLYQMPDFEENFLRDKITDFIRKVKSYEVLQNFVEKYQNNNTFDSDSVVTELSNALDVQLNITRIFDMNNYEQVKQVRLEAVGNQDNSKIIKSFIPTFNQALAFGGYQPGTVSMIVAPPGCFTGDTKIMTFGGESRTLQELYDTKINPGIYGAYTDATISLGLSEGIYLSDYVDELIDVEIDNKYHVRCTPDHPFMLRDGSYKRADKLTKYDELMPIRREYDGSHVKLLECNHKVTNTSSITLEEKVPVYGVVDAKPYGNYAIALDNETGVFVHNTGKSMFLINEGVNASRQHFKVLHIFIGDMVEYDGLIRYLSCVSNVKQTTLINAPSEDQFKLINFCNEQYDNILKRIYILAYPSLSINVDTLIEEINKSEKSLGEDFDMIIIDYPDNLVQDGKSLYEDGGTLYSSLERLSRLTKSVVLVASQPGKTYWNHEIIPLEGAAESSKKQQAVDNMLTMNTATRGANFGSIFLPKARKGTVGKIFRFKTEFECCKIYEIDEATYNALKNTPNNSYD